MFIVLNSGLNFDTVLIKIKVGKNLITLFNIEQY